MKKAIIIAAIALTPLAACKKNETPTVENASTATETELVNQADALNANVSADANNAAAAAATEANSQIRSLDKKTDAIRAEAMNTH